MSKKVFIRNRCTTMAVIGASVLLVAVACGSPETGLAPGSVESSSPTTDSTTGRETHTTDPSTPATLPALAGTEDADLTRGMSAHGTFHTGCGDLTDDTVWNGVGMVYSAASFEATLNGVFAGQHDCYDRVVFDITTPKLEDEYSTEYNVGYYVDFLDANELKWDRLPVAGNAQAKIVVNFRTPEAMTGYDFRTGGKQIREIKFLGESEGKSTFGVGLSQPGRARLSEMLSNGREYLVVDFEHP